MKPRRPTSRESRKRTPDKPRPLKISKVLKPRRMRKLLPKRRNRKRATKRLAKPPVPPQRQLARMPKRLQAARPPLNLLPLRRLVKQPLLRVHPRRMLKEVLMPVKLMELRPLEMPPIRPKKKQSRLLTR